MTVIEPFVAKELHSLLFFEEFTFSKNKFTPQASSELELADAIVKLGDALLVYQIKERARQEKQTPEAETKWFKREVLGRATKQVRDTINFLDTYQDISIPNERGRIFRISKQANTELRKFVIYHDENPLPESCTSVRHHISKTAGFIHIINAKDYLEIFRTLRVPKEVLRYFDYREELLTLHSSDCTGIPEQAIAGHFIAGDQTKAPTAESARHLHKLIQDADAWDMTPVLRNLHKNTAMPGFDSDYYEILTEFAKLSRSSWRIAKERFTRSIENARQDKAEKPYRFTDPQTGCGFVFVPVISEISQSPDWGHIRLNALENFTHAHKYDQRLNKCVGVLVAKVGEFFEIFWCLVSFEWEKDDNMQAWLDNNYPFRAVEEKYVPAYLLKTE